jgi:5-methylcytosine-specific restriction protein A
MVCRSLVSDGSTRCADHKVKAGSFADSRRGSRHARGYGTAWDKLRAETLAAQAGLCQPCLKVGVATPNCNTVDHIVPKAQGGADAASNRQTICGPCHAVKTAAEARLARLGAPLDTLDGAATPGGPSISATSAARTDQFVELSHAGYLAGGGI